MQCSGKNSRVLENCHRGCPVSLTSFGRLKHTGVRGLTDPVADPQLWPFGGCTETLSTWLALFICGGGDLHATEAVCEVAPKPAPDFQRLCMQTLQNS